TGGGTGGHVFPGLALAEYLIEQEAYECLWIGSGKAIEHSIVKRWDMPFYSIPAGKLRRYFSLRTLIDAFRVLAGFFASLVLLRRLSPDLLFSKGGYVSVPPVYAARVLGIPVITHDSDYDPGLATRLNARVADRVCVPYQQSLDFFPGLKPGSLVVTGNPVRKEVYLGDAGRWYAKSGMQQDKPLLFVQGGSQGAEELNDFVLDSLPQLLEFCCVVHQTGEHGYQRCLERLQSDTALQGRYFPQAFFTKEYPDILAAAICSVCRAGAGTLWELAAVQLPAVVIPLHGGSRGDQLRNAKLFAGMGMVDVQADRDWPACVAQVFRIMQNEAQQLAMKQALAGLNARQAVERLAQECKEMLCS
ncbi:MAG: undecaprenyldiphospho-muramoylpentapeptide beta-N-acetylglucosaminyltransferase, partial [Spirochaetaceae bacterium]